MIYSKRCVAPWWLPIYTMPSAEAILCGLPTPVIGTKHFHNTPPNPGLFWWGSWGFSEHASPRGSWESHQHFQLQSVPWYCAKQLSQNRLPVASLQSRHANSCLDGPSHDLLLTSKTLQFSRVKPWQIFNKIMTDPCVIYIFISLNISRTCS